MLTEQTFLASVTFADSKGKPAKVDGAPVWATDNSDVLTIAPAADGMSCQVTSSIIAGAAKLKVSADADLGAGVVLIEGTLDVTVDARPATSVVITAGPATDTP